LHVCNSLNIEGKLTHAGGTLSTLLTQSAEDATLIEELYLTFYNRFPTDNERIALAKNLNENSAERRKAVEDIAWSMLNSPEFLFNH
jgi:hypothetical protein